jgi:hypothetical protein
MRVLAPSRRMCHVTVMYEPRPIRSGRLSLKGYCAGEDLVSQRAVEPARKRATVHRAGLSRNLAPVTKEDQRRDAADVEAAGELLLLIRVDLCNLQSCGALLGCAFEHGGHHSARSAPRSPEIHEHGETRTLYVCGETCGVQRHRLAREEFRLAARTFRMLARSVGWHAHDRVTLRTGGDDGIRSGGGVHGAARIGACGGTGASRQSFNFLRYCSPGSRRTP